MGQDPELLRRLLRAKDRMDVFSHVEGPIRRLARVSGVSEAHFARSFKKAFGLPPHRACGCADLDPCVMLTDRCLPVGWQACDAPPITVTLYDTTCQ